MLNIGSTRARYVVTTHHRKKPRKVTAATRRRGAKPDNRTRGDVISKVPLHEPKLVRQVQAT